MVDISFQVNIKSYRLQQEFDDLTANQGPDSTLVDEANRTRWSPKPSSSRVIKLMDRTRVTWPQGKS